MANTSYSIVMLAAGQGTRMKSDKPKVMHPLAGRPMIQHGLATLTALAPAPAQIAIVIGPGMAAVAKAVAPWPRPCRPSAWARRTRSTPRAR